MLLMYQSFFMNYSNDLGGVSVIPGWGTNIYEDILAPYRYAYVAVFLMNVHLYWLYHQLVSKPLH